MTKPEQATKPEQTPTNPKPRRWRSILSGILIVTALLLTPVAALGAWGRVQLVDTDRFVATFAPLSQDPAVQQLIADEASAAILAKLDVEGIVADIFDGIDSLGLPPRALAALTLLHGPAVHGVESLVNSATLRVVASPQFTQTWQTALRVTHNRTTSLIQGGNGGLVNLDDAGVIAIDVGFVVDEVRASLTERGVVLARLIPPVNHSISLVQADALALVRTAYTTAATVGYWLPILVLALMAGGILLALDRRRALVRTGIATAVVLGVVLAAIGIGRMVVVGMLGTLLIPGDAVSAIYSQVTAGLRATLIALTVLATLVAIVAWLTGGSLRATAVRTALDERFASARAASDQRGFTTGAFGQFVQRWRTIILALGLAVTIVALLFVRPITLGIVVGILLAFVAFVIAVELVRQPEAIADPAPATAPTAKNTKLAAKA